MTRKLKFLWLEGIFDDDTVKLFPSVSAASNFWQTSFIESLIKHDSRVDVVGFPAERVWPFGPLWISKKNIATPKHIGGVGLGYLNFPFVRILLQCFVLFVWIIKYLRRTDDKPDFIVVYSCLVASWTPTAPIWVARIIRRITGIPLLCVVADGAAPKGADYYVYLPWSSFLLAESGIPALHLDGGVPLFSRDVTTEDFSESDDKVIFMYIGALTEHGGINELASAFVDLKNQNAELWICGRGDNDQLRQLASREHRIKLMGFLDDNELYKLAFQATFFVNPRPLNFDPNKLNFPSKILLYLAFGKPVISTITEGMSPEYESLVLRLGDESHVSLIEAMRSAVYMDQVIYNNYCDRAVKFKKEHTWDLQVSKFIDWL